MHRFLVLLLFFLLGSAQAQANYRVSYHEEEKFQLIEFSGEIFAALIHPDLDQVLAQIHGTKDLVLKVGASQGGVIPRFIWFIEKIKEKCAEKKGSACFLTTVFTHSCASACTLFPLYSDHTVSLPSGRLGFHRTWILSRGLTLQSESRLANVYAQGRGDAQWFSANAERLSSNQVSCYWMTKREEQLSGLIDEEAKNWPAFKSSYVPASKL